MPGGLRGLQNRRCPASGGQDRFDSGPLRDEFSRKTVEGVRVKDLTRALTEPACRPHGNVVKWRRSVANAGSRTSSFMKALYNVIGCIVVLAAAACLGQACGFFKVPGVDAVVPYGTWAQGRREFPRRARRGGGAWLGNHRDGQGQGGTRATRRGVQAARRREVSRPRGGQHGDEHALRVSLQLDGQGGQRPAPTGQLARTTGRGLREGVQGDRQINEEPQRLQPRK